MKPCDPLALCQSQEVYGVMVGMARSKCILSIVEEGEAISLRANLEIVKLTFFANCLTNDLAFTQIWRLDFYFALKASLKLTHFPSSWTNNWKEKGVHGSWVDQILEIHSRVLGVALFTSFFRAIEWSTRKFFTKEIDTFCFSFYKRRHDYKMVPSKLSKDALLDGILNFV